MTTDAQRLGSGPYRGVVVSNIDPYRTGRLLVRVEDVLGDNPSIWASPTAAFAGMHSVPLPLSGVWVQFENGDPDKAVWTGFWRGGLGDVPPIAQTVPDGVPQVVLGTPTHHSILITDAPGPTGGIQIQLRAPTGPYIKLNETGVEISAGPGLASIRLVGAQVLINKNALIVT
jgi:hypothetical protein